MGYFERIFSPLWGVFGSWYGMREWHGRSDLLGKKSEVDMLHGDSLAWGASQQSREKRLLQGDEIFYGFFFCCLRKGRTRVRGTGFTEKHGGNLRKKGAKGKKRVSVGVVHEFSREFLEQKQWETHHKFAGEKHFSGISHPLQLVCFSSPFSADYGMMFVGWE